MTLGEAMLRFGFQIDRSSISAIENTVKGIKGMATKVLGAIGIGFTIHGIANLAEAAADVEATASQFTQVFGDMEKQASSSLSQIANDTGIVENRFKGSYTQIAAFAKTTGMETTDALNLTNRSMKAVADSSAFYDRSLEEVTGSLQSFLKGNFENDAALGLSCTETTRNAAANTLYGKSFKDLAEDQKQLTLLQMVEDANQLSGALGQAARESDTWTNQLGNFQQSLTDLKAAIGKTFLKTAIGALKIFSGIIQTIAKKIPNLVSGLGNMADKMFGVTNGENHMLRAFRAINDMVKKLKPVIDRMMQTLSDGVTKAVRFVRNMIDHLGGVENALKILAIVAGAFLLVMNWNKLTSGAGLFLKLISGIGKMFSFANLKILAVVAIVVLLALIVEDFINFLMGNDSVIGTIFDKAGIGADNARQAIFNAWEKVKEFLLEVWDFIKKAAGVFIDAVKDYFAKHGESIRANFERAWGLIKKFLSGVWTFLSQLATTIFGSTEDEIEGSQQSTKDKMLSVWQKIVDTLSAVWDAIYEACSAVFNAIATVIEFVFDGLKAFWDAWGSKILAWFKMIWDSCGKVLNGFLDIIKGIANFISSVFTGDWEGAWEAIKQIFSGIWDAIVGVVKAVWDTIKLLFDMALSAIKAVWEAIWDAISSFFMGLWNGIVSFFQGIWAAITSTISNAINNARNTIVNVFTAIKDFISNIITGMKDGITNTFKNIVTGIKNSVGNIKDTIVEGFTKAINWVKELPGKALKWGADIIGGIVDGIKGAIGKVTDAVKGIADKIKSFLHFSVPEEGPLTDYESWMPDFMGGLAKGISGNEDMVLDKVKGLANGIAILTQAATAQVATVANSSVSTSASYVTQNNAFNNAYYGGDTKIQANTSKAMNRSVSDATAQLAKGLAYAR